MMSERSTQKYASFTVGSTLELTNQQLKCLTRLFRIPVKTLGPGLIGRSSVTISHLKGIGFVVVKHYTRGGFIRYFLKQRYLRWGRTRGETEFKILQKARQIGVSVPEPIAYAFKGGLFYKGWLVSRKIEEQQTLAKLACDNEGRTDTVMENIIEQIAILIDHRILHVDLHPGNILIDHANRVFLIDFDKARITHKNRKMLTERYINRWRRAVIKHQLPQMLIETLDAGLSNRH
jgi:3-deoxy-D-manno-octulosonic acid kinase